MAKQQPKVPSIEAEPVEAATRQVRIFETDYKFISEVARSRRTIVGQIIREMREAYEHRQGEQI